MLHCGACGKFLSSAGAAACSVCPLKYHKAWLAVSDKASICKDWACPNCKRLTHKGDNTQTPVKDLCGTSSSIDSASVYPKSDVIVDAPDGREDRRDRELAVFMAEMREFRKEMLELRDSLSARLDNVEQRLEVLEQRRPDISAKVTAELDRTIDELKQELNDRDQEALLSDLEIGQLPKKKEVSVVQAVTVLAARLGVTLEQRDVVFAERIGAPLAEAGGRPRRTVVRLARRQLRDELLQAARVRRTVAGAAGGRVYINERLTRHNRQLFHQVREECKKLQWRYSWTKRGRIFVRQADGSPAYQLRSKADLEWVLGSQK